MNLLELHKLWEQFNQLIDSPRLDVSVKQVLGGEMLNALPPVMLCSSFSLSRGLIEEDMKGRLNELKERYERGSKETSKAEEEVRAEPKHGSKRSREKPVQKDAAD